MHLLKEVFSIKFVRILFEIYYSTMSQDKLYSLNLISNENIFLINLNYEQPINNLTIKNCKEKCTQKNKMQREYLNKFEVFF
jgi:hypothetical protein